MEYICKICNKKFENNNNITEYGQKGAIAQAFKKHLKEDHNITFEKYIIDNYYNGINPTCACGCGEKLKFYSKNALWKDNHGFLKYINCGHVARNNEQIKNKHKENYISKWNNIEWLKEHYYNQYGKDNIENSAKDFLENNDITNIEIGQKYGIDIRTLHNIWINLNLISKEQWKDRCKYRKYSVSSKRRKKHLNNKEEICSILYNIIKNFPHQYNIRSLIKYYNDNNLLQIEADVYVVLNSLVELYGNEIYDLLQYGLHSKEENEFIKVLKYLVKGKYKIGLRLQYGENKKYSYIYDICINNKYIIEYDSIGKYHDNIELDKIKENFAIKNGYKIIRISYEEFRNPLTYIKINNWIKND